MVVRETDERDMTAAMESDAEEEFDEEDSSSSSLSEFEEVDEGDS